MDPTKRICFLNIMHGSTILKAKNILKSIADLNPEIVSFSEFRKNATGEYINKRLVEEGYTYSNFNSLLKEGNHVVVYSKSPFDLLELDYQLPKQRIIKIKYKAFIMFFVHIPGIKNIKFSKKTIWDALHSILISTNNKILMIGDFNTGLAEDSQGIKFKYNNKYKDLLNLNFIDIWRNFNNSNEYSWYSNKRNGFRVDQAITQKENLELFSNCYYDHSVRLNKSSDHSMIIVEMTDQS